MFSRSVLCYEEIMTANHCPTHSQIVITSWTQEHTIDIVRQENCNINITAASDFIKHQ